MTRLDNEVVGGIIYAFGDVVRRVLEEAVKREYPGRDAEQDMHGEGRKIGFYEAAFLDYCADYAGKKTYLTAI